MDAFIEKTDNESGKHKTEIVTEFGEDQASHILGMYSKIYIFLMG